MIYNYMKYLNSDQLFTINNHYGSILIQTGTTTDNYTH